MNELKIYNLNDAINVVKEDLTAVNYYLFDEYEIHLNVLPPHTIQPWHFHRQIEEVIVVIKGKMQCLWFDANHKHCQEIKEKQIVAVKNSIHTFKNNTNDSCEFIVFRLLLSNINKRDIFKNDKIIVDDKYHD